MSNRYNQPDSRATALLVRREKNMLRITTILIAASLLGGIDSAPAQSDPLFVFRDVAEETGLMPMADRLQGHGAAWGDVDGDGWADLYIATFHYRETLPNHLFLNRSGRFKNDAQPSLQISTRGTGVVFADFDNDGDLDLYVGSMPGTDGSRLATRHGHPFAGCSLFRNNSDGTFANVSANNAACPAEFGGRSAAVLDIDGDGLLDLLVGEEPVTGYNGSKTRRSRLFRNLGDLKFEDVTDAAGIPDQAAGLGVAALDANADTFPDIFLASTLGNYLLLNDGRGSFSEARGARETFAWQSDHQDDMVCGVAAGDVNGDRLPDIVLGQHFDSPWKNPVANRLYLHQGNKDGHPQYRDVTEAAGLVPLPMKGPHVEIQDFDNDGRFDIYTSIVMFEGDVPHPVIFRNLGNQGGIPRFKQTALSMNDFPTQADRATRRSGEFFAKMIADRKVFYSAPGPTCDFDRDGRLDMILPSWWIELPTMLLKNETPSGNWLKVSTSPPASAGTNAMGVGARVDLYESGKPHEPEFLIASREIAVGYGYASGQEAVAHFGLGSRSTCELTVTLPHQHGTIKINDCTANQHIIVDAAPQQGK